MTSSNTVAGQAAAGLEPRPQGPGFVLGIVKAYTTRVGEGRSRPSCSTRSASTLGTVGKEFGVVTGRPRRCGWFDAVLVRQSVALNGIDGIALTKLDILDGLDELKICTGYKLGGKMLDYLPAGLKAAGRPWSRSMRDGGLERKHRRRHLAGRTCPAAVKYVRRVEELIRAPAAMVSTSPQRDDTIMVRDPVQD